MMSLHYTPIPQNNTYFFLILQNKWDFSLDILFEHHYDTSLINLYLLLKSYIIDKNFIIKSILLISKEATQENDASLAIYYQLSLRRFSQLSYLEFVDWFEEKYEENWKYIESQKYYGFRFIFFSESINIKKNEIFPIYPWNENFKKELIGHRVENFFLSENLNLKNKIKQLESKIKLLEELKKN